MAFDPGEQLRDGASGAGWDDADLWLAAVDPVDPVDVAGRLRLGVTRLARILRQQDSASLGPTLSSALATVNHEGPLTLGDLSAREHISPPSVTKVVEKLVGAGYISRRV